MASIAVHQKMPKACESSGDDERHRYLHGDRDVYGRIAQGIGLPEENVDYLQDHHAEEYTDIPE